MLKPKFKSDPLKNRKDFRTALNAWFLKNGKDYPWRRTEEAYAILISEVMLQQTQIATVLGRGFYTRFLEMFPTVQSLARADDERLLKAWEGLGYYRRVRMLRETARAVIAEYGGDFPMELDPLMKLPGIGRYTANALRAFAADLPAAVVDGNVARVFSRMMDFQAVIDDSAGQKQMWEWAEILADRENSRIYNSALMELGQTICRPGVPDCLSCPVAKFCKTQEPELLPIKRQKVIVTAVDEHALWLIDAGGRILLHREGGKRREGLWKLPTRDAEEISTLPILTELNYTITRYRVTLRVHHGEMLREKFELIDGEVWQAREDILALAMPSPFRKAIEKLLSEN